MALKVDFVFFESNRHIWLLSPLAVKIRVYGWQCQLFHIKLMAEVEMLVYKVFSLKIIPFLKDKHSYIPVTPLTKLLCPYLMAKTMAPYVYSIICSPKTTLLILYVYLQCFMYVSSYRLTLSIILSNPASTVWKYLKYQRKLKKVGLI